jgi:hypothetical protein
MKLIHSKQSLRKLLEGEVQSFITKEIGPGKFTG